MQAYNANNWWDGAQSTLPAMAQLSLPDTSSLVPVGMPNVSATPAPSMWDGLSSWMNNSGVLGKTLAEGTKVQGWGMPALNLASGLTNAFFGQKQYQLAKDTLDQNKKQFQLNFDAQRKTTNSALADRQASRVAANPGAYQSVGDYMKQYGI